MRSLSSIFRGQLGRVFRAQLLAGSSNLIGAAQLLLLIHLSSATRTTDTYVFLFASGQAILIVWIVAVLYASRLTERGRSFSEWSCDGRRAAYASAGVSALACGYLIVAGYEVTVVLAIAVPLVVSNSLATLGGTWSVFLATEGQPSFLAANALAPNVCALLVLVVFSTRPALFLTGMMCIGLLVGNIAFCVFTRKIARQVLPVSRLLVNDANLCMKPSPWLVAGAVVGYGGFLSLQAAAARLSPGNATTFALIMKVVLSSVGVGLQAAFPVISNRGTTGVGQLRVLANYLVSGATLVFVLFAVLRLVSNRNDLLPTVVVLAVGWAVFGGVVTCIHQAIGQLGLRVAYRSVAVVGALIVMGGTLVAILYPRISFLLWTAIVMNICIALLYLRHILWRGYRLTLTLAFAAFCATVAGKPFGPLISIVCGTIVLLRHRSWRWPNGVSR